MRRRTWLTYEHQYNQCHRGPGRCTGHTVLRTAATLDLIDRIRTAGRLGYLGPGHPTLRQRILTLLNPGREF